MPTTVGPNTYGEENLVFSYDLGDSKNSYKGEPTTNLIDGGANVAECISDVWYRGSHGASVNVYTNQYYSAQRPHIIRAISTNTTAYYMFNQRMSSNATSGVTYAYSFDYKPLMYYGGTWTPTVGVYGDGYKVPNSSYTGTNYAYEYTPLADGWTRFKFTYTADYVGRNTFRFNMHTNDTTDFDILFDNFQIEQKGYVTPYTPGTRSVSGSLIDLTGNATINLSNVSFDSNGEMAFDGTNDYVNITISPSQPMYCLETVFYNVNAIPGNDSTIGGPTTYQSMFRFNQDYPIGVHLGSWTSGLTNEAIHIWSTGTSPYNATNTRTAVASGWHHLVFNWNGSYYDIYVDGVQQDVYAHTDGHATLITLSHLTLGNSVSPNYAFNGNLNMVKIYNRSLTTSEISANFKAIKGRFNI